MDANAQQRSIGPPIDVAPYTARSFCKLYDNYLFRRHNVITEEQVLNALRPVMDPEIHRSIVEMGMVRDITVDGTNIDIVLALTVPNCPLRDQIANDAAQAVDALDDDLTVEIHLTAMNDEEREAMRKTLQGGGASPEMPAGNLNRVKTVIAVMSGKGGVGKSTVAAMVAVGLRRKGLRVGVLDSDITGPSIPKLFGVKDAPMMSPLGIMPPQTSMGIKMMSINLMLENEEQAVIWRGPMITSAINQFWNDVFWGDLDALVVDMPPGTSDAALTVMQNLPVTGIILVTSPQDLAGMVVRKAAHMAEHLETPLIGVVENMSYAVCPHCGERYAIFGQGDTQTLAETFNTRFLGKIGIDPEMSKLADQGAIETYENGDFQTLIDVAQEVVDQAPALKFNSQREA
jgi:Mrp family chromosome partitioning ATPase